MATREEIISGEDRNEVQQLTEEIPTIMDTVNSTLAGENIAFSDEFIGLEEAIHATLHVGYANCSYFSTLLIISYSYALYKYNLWC